MTITRQEGAGRSLIVGFSQLRWGFVFQRPQHLMMRAAKRHRVMFWEEPIFDVVEEPFLDCFFPNDKLTVITPRLPLGMNAGQVNSALRRLLDSVLQDRDACEPFIAWYWTPMGLAFSEHLRPQVTVYDNMDELAAFDAAPAELMLYEEKLLARADVVFTGGMSLYEAKCHRHRNIHPLPSSVDQAHFRAARNRAGEEPHDQVAISSPRIGWFGVIDERFDAKLVLDVALLRPEWQFVLLGPVVKRDPAALPRLDNLHWLGSKTYSDLPAYLSGWNAGFMPFALNASTRYISPTKTPEFLAAGVPLASTPIRDIIRPYGELGLAEIAHTPEEMVCALERAMAKPKDVFAVSADAFLADKSWDRTWAEMERHIEKARIPAPAMPQEAAA